MAKIVREFVFRIGTIVREKYPKKKRAARTAKIIKEGVKRQMKLGDDVKVVMHPELNALIWSRGAEKPPRRIKVRAEYDEDEGLVKILPAHE
jgi:large subunit ribosomal protein L31e